MSDDEQRRVLASAGRFARARDAVAVRQLVVVGLLWAAWGVAFAVLGGLVTAPLFGLVLAALLVRTFVLQHDLGHNALLSSRRANRAIGHVLGAFTGVPFVAWALEHDWHHQHQGQLDHRGVDRMNSPMTVDEARVTPEDAARRVRTISPVRIFVLGAWSLVMLRKRARGFFFFRPRWRWTTQQRPAVVRSVRETWLSHGGLHLAALVTFGWKWLPAALVCWLVAAGTGATLFWVQHNFERTWHAPPEEWSFVRVALEGSSYLRLPAPLAWVTGNIGLHHVHHLNPHIPNYRLEEARSTLPELEAAAPLTFAELRGAYQSVFWDEERTSMVTAAALAPPSRARRAASIPRASRAAETS